MGDLSEAQRFIEAASVRRLAPLRSFDPKARTVEVVWTTGARVQRFDWWEGESFYEELEVSESAIDLSRLNNGASILNSHNGYDLSKVIGVTERAWIEKGEGLATLRFSKRDDVAPIVQDVADGILRHVSVGYFILQLEQRGFDETTGFRIMVATRWQPFEISFVGVNADADANVRSKPANEKRRCVVIMSKPAPQSDGADRAAPEQPAQTTAAEQEQAAQEEVEVSVTRSTEVNPAAPSANSGVIVMAEAQAAAGASAGQQSNITAVEAEKERRQAILDMCASNKIDSRVRDGWIADGAPLHLVAKGILDVMEERGKAAPTTAADVGMSRGDTKRYSLFRAIRALHYGAQNPALMREAAFEIECSQQVAKQIGRGDTTGILVPGEILQRSVGKEAATRAMSAQPGSKGGYMVNVENMGFIDILRNRSVAIRMGARQLSGLTGNVTIPRQTGKASVTWQAGEGVSVTAGDQALGQLSMTPKTAICVTDVSEQLLRQASPSAEAFVMADLAAVVAIDGVDSAAINGTGGAQPLGIKNTTGVTSNQDASSATYAKILAFVSGVGANNAIRGNPGWVTNTAGAAKLMQVQRFTSTDSPLWTGNMLDGELVGFPAMSSEQLSSGNILFGSWDELVIGDWGVLELSTDNGGTRFNQAQVGVRALWMVDVLVRYPTAFIMGTNLS